MIVTVDREPDENPRYEKAITYMVNYFSTYDLDAFFLVTNAPECREFNRVERTMARLSKELGDTLPEHKHFGAYLDDKGSTIDPQLKFKNLNTPKRF